MSAFRSLQEVSNNFEADLHRASAELFTAKVSATFEEVVAEKFRDLSLFTAKLSLLRAKPVSLNPQISLREKDEATTLSDYGDAVVNRLIEQRVVKSVTQAHAVKKLLTAPDSMLEPEMVERKEKIIAALAEYTKQEASVQGLDSVLTEKEKQCNQLRIEWDGELAALRSMAGSGEDEVDVNDPLYQRLGVIVEKLELMRWLMSRLSIQPPPGYDWLTDSQRRLQLIKLARKHYTVESILHG